MAAEGCPTRAITIHAESDASGPTQDGAVRDEGGARCRSPCPMSTRSSGGRPAAGWRPTARPRCPRSLLDADTEELQPVWKEMAAQGWLGIHLPEEFGGQGFGLFELAVLLEETGWSVVPGPLLPTVRDLGAAGRRTPAGPSRATGSCRALVDGTSLGAVYLGDDAPRRGRPRAPDGGARRCSGTLRAGARRWYGRRGAGAGPDRRPGGLVPGRPAAVTEAARPWSRCASLDETRRVGRLSVRAVTVPVGRQLRHGRPGTGCASWP